ncbi:hypothetical protein THAOC_28477, partial [Thalassiosira oceanica]
MPSIPMALGQTSDLLRSPMINSQSYTLPCGRGTPRYRAVEQPQQDPHKSFNSIFCKRPPALAIFYVPPTIPCTTTRLSKVSLGARSWIEASNLPENLATQQSTHLTPTEASSNYTKLCLQTRPPPEGLGAHLCGPRFGSGNPSLLLAPLTTKSSSSTARAHSLEDDSGGLNADRSGPLDFEDGEGPRSLGPNRAFLGVRRESGVLRRMMEAQSDHLSPALRVGTALSSSATALMPDGGLSPCVI